jgi:ankyrin repeat protein
MGINNMKETWFHAVKKNNIEKVKELINQGVDINIQDEHDNTALIYSSYYGCIEITEFLLNQPGIDINIKNKNGNDSLFLAFWKDSRSYLLNDRGKFKIKDIIKLLLSRKDIKIDLFNFNYSDIYKHIKYCNYLKNYILQKKILENDREDIILFLNEYDLIESNFKKENPDLFNANDWGLI